MVAGSDIVVMAVALWASFALRLDESWPQRFHDVAWLVVAVPVLSLPGLHLVGVFAGVVLLFRY